MAQEKLGAALAHPAGKLVRSVVTLRLVAAASSIAPPVSVVKLTLTDCMPAPMAALIWPEGRRSPTDIVPRRWPDRGLISCRRALSRAPALST